MFSINSIIEDPSDYSVSKSPSYIILDNTTFSFTRGQFMFSHLRESMGMYFVQIYRTKLTPNTPIQVSFKPKPIMESKIAYIGQSKSRCGHAIGKRMEKFHSVFYGGAGRHHAAAKLRAAIIDDHSDLSPAEALSLYTLVYSFCELPYSTNNDDLNVYEYTFIRDYRKKHPFVLLND